MTNKIKAGIFNEQTGKLVNLKQVSLDDDIMLIADDGVIIRVSAEEISKIGRNTKGVRIMKMKEGSKIVCVAVTKSEKAEEEIAESLQEEVVADTTVIENTAVQEMSLDSDVDSTSEDI